MRPGVDLVLRAYPFGLQGRREGNRLFARCREVILHELSAQVLSLHVVDDLQPVGHVLHISITPGRKASCAQEPVHLVMPIGQLGAESGVGERARIERSGAVDFIVTGIADILLDAELLRRLLREDADRLPDGSEREKLLQLAEDCRVLGEMKRMIFRKVN